MWTLIACQTSTVMVTATVYLKVNSAFKSTSHIMYISEISIFQRYALSCINVYHASILYAS